MRSLFDTIQKFTGVCPQIQIKILVSVLIIIVLWALRAVGLHITWKKTDDPRSRYLWKKTLSYAISTLGIFLIGIVWIKSLGQLGTFLGLLSAGIAIAMKDIISNIAGWFFIITRRPFTVGDRIQVGGATGDVIDIKMFQFTLMEIGNWVDADQSTGRIIHVPNGKVFTDPLANYSRGFEYIWHEIPVLVTFESDWEKAKTILKEIVQRHARETSLKAEQKIKEASRHFLIFYKHLTPIVYTTVRDSGVLLTIRYLCDPRKRRGTEQAIWEDILKEFKKYPNIELAYPTQRYYVSHSDGKDQKIGPNGNEQ